MVVSVSSDPLSGYSAPGTETKKMAFVDTSIYAKWGKNVLKCAENFITGLKAPHSIFVVEWVHLE